MNAVNPQGAATQPAPMSHVEAPDVAQPAASATPAGTDANATRATFMTRAGALSPGDVVGGETLAADIVASGLSEATFEALAEAIAKSTAKALNRDKLYRNMLRARQAASNTDTGDDTERLEPAANPKPLAEILNMIHHVVRRQVWCSEHDAAAVAIFIVATYGYGAADVFPRLAITSEMRRCGKSTLLTTAAHFAFNPELADNISPAAMFRMIAARPMTLLIDEVDSFGRDDNGLRNILNAGHSRNGAVKRVEPTPDGKGYNVVSFKCFAPVVLAGIGSLPDTVLDRSIIVRLQRAPKDQQHRRLRLRELARYRRGFVPQLLAHAAALEHAIATGTPNLPPSLNDRACDNWEPLIAVAELAGGDWPARALAAATALSGGTDEGHGLVEKLLADVREIVEAPRRHAAAAWRAWCAAGRTGPRPARLTRAQRPTAIRTADLLVRLVSMAHRPWPEISHGRPITERWLADRLRGLGVVPGRARVQPWTYDDDGALHPLGAGGPPPAIQARTPVPQARSYVIADLRAAYRRCL